jgi:hypothetical protein
MNKQNTYKAVLVVRMAKVLLNNACVIDRVTGEKTESRQSVYPMMSR